MNLNTAIVISAFIFPVIDGNNNDAQEPKWSTWENEVAPPHPSILEKIYTETEPTLLVSGGPPNPHSDSVAAFSLPQMGIYDNVTVQIIEDIKHGLHYLFQTKNSNTLAVVGTGSLGIEVVLDNLVEPGDTVLILLNGMWTEQVKDLVMRLRGIPILMEKEADSTFTMEQVELQIRTKKPKLVYAVNGESSSGVFQKVDFIGDLCHRHGCISILDVAHIVGLQPFFMDKWKIDTVVCNSQKGIGAPVGLAPLSFSQRAVDKIMNRTSSTHSRVNDFRVWRSNNYWKLDPSRSHNPHHSIPVLLLYTLREALAHLSRDGLASTWKRHAQADSYLRNALWEEFPFLVNFVKEPSYRLLGAVIVILPPHINSTLVRNYIRQKHNTDVSNGIGPAQGKVLRFSLIGRNANFYVANKLLVVLRETFAHFNLTSSKNFNAR